MSQLGDPDGYARVISDQFGPPSPALLAELDQVVKHWRAAGWNDLAIGAMLAASATHRIRTVHVLRSVI